MNQAIVRVLLHSLRDLPVLIVLSTFIFAVIYTCINYLKVSKNLKTIIDFLSNFGKNDLSFKFKELDEWMLGNPWVATIWQEFKTTLVFSETVALKKGPQGFEYQDVSANVQNILTTSDSQFYFDEETLATSKFNNKLVNGFPEILTGLGPLFTFLNIVIAFGMIDFTSQQTIVTSISSFMLQMQVAAFVSVVAVGSSLTFTLMKTLMWNKMIRIPLEHIQMQLGLLFESISAEKFLHEILRETKIQNNATSTMISEIPDGMKNSLDSSVTNNVVPYLENVIFGLNQLNKEMKEVAKNSKGSGGLDDLF